MIKSDNNKLYIGVSEDVNKRLYLHNKNRGANFTKDKKFRLVFIEKYLTLSEARRREIQLKKWSRIKKEFLIDKYSKNLPTKM